MRPRVVALSVAGHGVLVTLLVLGGTHAQPPTTVDIELVVPRVAVAPAPPAAPVAEPPVVPARHTPGGGVRPADPPPSPRPASIRRATRPAPPPIPAPAAAPLLPVEAAAPSDSAAPSEPAAADRDPAGAGSGTGAAGSGAGAGGGDGDGLGAMDRSSRAIPLDGSAPQTRMYTEEALRDRVSGDVQLVLTVDPLGRVGKATVRRGLGHGLDELATRIALQIRFRPATDRDGRPIPSTVRWRFHFEPP